MASIVEDSNESIVRIALTNKKEPLGLKTNIRIYSYISPQVEFIQKENLIDTFNIVLCL